jgi:hypothetical protein
MSAEEKTEQTTDNQPFHKAARLLMLSLSLGALCIRPCDVIGDRMPIDRDLIVLHSQLPPHPSSGTPVVPDQRPVGPKAQLGTI